MLKGPFNWAIFIVERFSPASFLPMIFVMIASHAVRTTHPVLHSTVALLFLFTLFFLFKLRLYDEIKDYQKDLDINPDRPLPRGLLHHQDLYLGIAICIIGELSLAWILKPQIITVALIPIIFSLFMFKEFFIGRWLRPLLTTYAVTHTFVMALLSLMLTHYFSGNDAFDFNARDGAYALGCWALFNLFEFGRKTFADEEERPGVESYSKTWKHSGAFCLALSQIILAGVALGWSVDYSVLQWIWTGIGLFLLLSAGILFLYKNTAKAARFYRNICGLVILMGMSWWIFPC